MKLLVDAGNTRLKWAWLGSQGLVDSGEPGDHGAIAHGGTVPDDLLVRIGAASRQPTAIAIASVASASFTASLRAALGATGISVRQVTTAAAFGELRNGYGNPAQMGVDRWLALIGAWQRHRRALCVVDAGTAVTLDVVDDQGQHLGGYIVPGAPLMRRALLGSTGGIDAAARLAAVADAEPLRWGRDTESCMALGATRALACLVMDSVKALALRSRAAPALLLTGGDASHLLAGLEAGPELRPQLVLEGLALAARDP